MTKEKTSLEIGMQTFNIIIEKGDDVFIADVPELRGCHTQAKTKRELMKRVREVIELCLKDCEGST